MTGNITIYRAELCVMCGRILFRQNFDPGNTYILSISDEMAIVEVTGDWKATWEDWNVQKSLQRRRVSRDDVLEIIRQGDTAMWDWVRFMCTWAAWSDAWDRARKEFEGSNHD
jgi:hypothetical protein